MKEHRVLDSGGNPMDFTCRNARFQTDMTKGKPHGSISDTRGSVFEDPLIEHGGYSLWLEHVAAKDEEGDIYWLMWYKGGIPTIPMSGVFWKKDLQEMVKQLAGFVP